MATLAALLKRKGLDVRGSDQDVYPPMSDFLAAEGIPALSGYRAEHITARSRSRRRRQRDLARQPRARRSARSQDPLLLAARGDPRAFSLGRAVDRHRRHARQDDDDVADRLAADARRRRSRACWSAASRATSASTGSSYRLGQGRDFVIEGDEYDSAFFDKTAKFLKYLPDIAVINNIEFDHADIYADLDAVTLAFRRLVNLVPRRGLLLLGADSPARARAGERARCRASRRSALGDDVDWQAHDIEPSRRLDAVQGAARRRAVRRFEVAAARRAQRAQRAGGDRRRDRSRHQRRAHRAKGFATFAGVKRRLEVVGVGRRRHGVRRFRAPSDGGGRNARRRCARRIPTARIWAVFEPRSASSCRRVFQDDFARAFAGADEVAARAGVPVDAAGDGAAVDPATGPRPRVARPVGRAKPRRSTTSSSTIVREHRSGDLVVLMSNGGFGGIHQKLLRRSAGVNAVSDRAGRRRRARRGVRGADRSGGQRPGDRSWPRRCRRRVCRASATSCRHSDRSRSISIRCTRTATCSSRESTREAAKPSSDRRHRPAAPVRVPVCYGGELGPDLAAVAAFCAA